MLRGSGLTGLSSMSVETKHNNHLKIIRPFLNFKKAELKYVTLNYFKTYIKDPSNSDDKFLRVRIRKYRYSNNNNTTITTNICKIHVIISYETYFILKPFFFSLICIKT